MENYQSEYNTFTKHIVYTFSLGEGGIGDFVHCVMGVLSHCIKHRIAFHVHLASPMLEKHLLLKFPAMYLKKVESPQTLINLNAELNPHVFYTINSHTLFTRNTFQADIPCNDVFTFSEDVMKTAQSFTLPASYTSVHLRIGDKFLETDRKFVLCKNDRRTFDEEKIFDCLKNLNNVVFFCDNFKYKMKIKNMFPHVYVTDWPIGHTSLSNTSEESFVYALSEFSIICQSSNVIGASKSGFAKAAALFKPVDFKFL